MISNKCVRVLHSASECGGVIGVCVCACMEERAMLLVLLVQLELFSASHLLSDRQPVLPVRSEQVLIGPRASEWRRLP